MADDHNTILWRETISADRVSSYLVTERPAPPHCAAGSGTPGALVTDLAEAFFEAVPACSSGLFSSTIRRDPPPAVPGTGATRVPHSIDGASLHPTWLPTLALIRFGPSSLRVGREHALLVLPVTGGLLAGNASGSAGSAGLAPHRKAGGWELGALAFEVLRFGGRVSLSVQVCDFPSRLIGPGDSPACRAVYRVTQSPVHRFLVGRFLLGAADRLAV